MILSTLALQFHQQVTVLLEIAAAFGYPRELATKWRGNNPCTWNSIDCAKQPGGGNIVVCVDMQNMGLSGTISPAFSNLTGLFKLNLNCNNLNGPIPESLPTLSKLELLDLSYNNLCGQVPKFSPWVKLYTAGNDLLHSPCGGALSGSPSQTLNVVLIAGKSLFLHCSLLVSFLLIAYLDPFLHCSLIA